MWISSANVKKHVLVLVDRSEVHAKNLVEEVHLSNVALVKLDKLQHPISAVWLEFP
jgi:orotate phosphoribosyltransferase